MTIIQNEFDTHRLTRRRNLLFTVLLRVSFSLAEKEVEADYFWKIPSIEFIVLLKLSEAGCRLLRTDLAK